MKKLSAFIALFLGVVLFMNAQPLRDLKTSQKLKIAEEQMSFGDYYNALDWYNKVLEDDPSDLNVIQKIADLQFKLRDLKAAQKWFGKVVKKDKTGKFPAARFHYARILKMNGELDLAQEEFEQFGMNSSDNGLKKLATKEIEGIQLSKSLSESEDITVKDAGDNINSPYTDFSPIYVGDDLFYGAMVAEEVIVLDGSAKDYFAKIYKAKRKKNGFSKGSPIEQSINKPGAHTGNVSVAPDGERIYFTRTEFSSNQITSSTLYMAQISNGEWGAATPVEGLGDYIVKHPAVGKMFGDEVIFFTSDKVGGNGGTDIYYAKIDGNGVSSPTNLGDKINTGGDESTPYYRDGKLYFSSTGHPTIGGADVFVSTWDGSWNAPENMGKGINTSYDDIYFSLDESGYEGLVVSNRPSSRSLKSKTCCDDIYTVSIKEVILDLEALTFQDAKGKKLKGVTLQLVEMLNGKEGKTESDTNKGGNKFKFDLAREMAYKIIATKDGYNPASVEFNTVGLGESQTITKKLTLTPIPVVPEYVEVEEIVYDTIRSQTPMRLNNILYDYDKSFIRTDAESDLSMVLSYLNSYPDLVIELSSHTDSKGNETYNQTLSQKRAEAAKSWLLNKGVSSERIKAVGYGESMPIAENKNADGSDNPEGRQMNRRTEFKIIGGPSYILSQTVKKRVIKKKVKK